MGKNLRGQEKKKAQKTQIICICQKKAVPLHTFWLLRAVLKTDGMSRIKDIIRLANP